jgi:FMN phosphatase YigB (HAD superfamily)
VGEGPDAVLFDVGGVLLLPTRERIVGAFERAECRIAADVLDAAHYTAAAAFTTDLDAIGDWEGCWRTYLAAYVDACLEATGIDAVEVDRDDIHRHVDSEFADAALWLEPIAGAKKVVEELRDAGVALGIVSNADGVMGERLRRLELVQVGPGLGVEIDCVIDSGAVGCMKPDPRIFQLALDAVGTDASRAWYVGDMPGIDVVGARRAGLRPFLLDPLGLHGDADYDRVGSLSELAGLVVESASRSASA